MFILCFVVGEKADETISAEFDKFIPFAGYITIFFWYSEVSKLCVIAFLCCQLNHFYVTFLHVAHNVTCHGVTAATTL